MRNKLLATVSHRCLEPLSIGLGLGFGLGLGAGGSVATPSTAGQPIGLLLSLTKAS